MDFFEVTSAWVKGEIFEALLSAGFGLVLIVVGLLFWFLGKTPNAQALLIPLLVIGAILSGSGFYNAYANNKKLAVYQLEYQQNKTAFIQAEKARVEGFEGLYTFTKYLATGLFAIALLLFFFVNNRHALAIAIALVLLGFSGLVIDYFSKERADIYYQEIINKLS